MSTHPHYFIGESVTNRTCVRIDGIHDFSGFVDHLLSNKHTVDCTRDEFLALDLGERKALKLGTPFFIAGVPRDPRERVLRKKCTDAGFLACIDIDGHDAAIRAKGVLESDGLEFGLLAYETISSRPSLSDPNDPKSGLRLRIVAAAERVSGKNEYRLLVETLANLLDLGKDEIDLASCVINQAMFFPVQFKGEDGYIYNNGRSRALRACAGQGGIIEEGLALAEVVSLEALSPTLGLGRDEMIKILRNIDPDLERPDWVKVLAGIKHECQDSPGGGMDIALAWSEGEYSEPSLKFDLADFERVWKSVKPHPKDRAPVTFATVKKMAQDSKHRSVAKKAGRRNSYKLKHISEIELSTESNDFVEGVFFNNTLSMVYGPSKTRKSFFILDIAACVCTGLPWREREVEQGGVLYVCLEGVRGFQKRVHAYIKEGRLSKDSPFYLFEASFNLLAPEDVQGLKNAILEQIESSPVAIVWVIIDTLSRSLPGANENAVEQMSQAIANAGLLQETGAAVTLIHHSGKNVENGARGSSALKGAVDTEIAIEFDEESRISTAKVTKQKDAEDGQKFPFTLCEVELGEDEKGKLMTSCVVEQLGEDQAPKKKKGGRQKEYSPEQLLGLLPVSDTKEWKNKARDSLGMSESSFKRYKAQLQPDFFQCLEGEIVDTRDLQSVV